MLSFFSPSSLDEDILRGRRPTSRQSHRRRRRQPRLESLETRITPSTDTWTGAVSNLWSNAGNWSSGAPATGEDLVFPAGASQLTAANDLSAGQTYNSITIAASGYQLLGNQVNLTTGITASYTSGTSLDNLNTTLGGGTVSVSPGGQLNLGGAFSGSPGLDLTGGGTLALVGAVGNSYLGTTTVDSGSTLLLEKTSSAIAVPGALTVNDGLVQDRVGSQITVGSPVSVNSLGTLDLNGFNESIGALTLTGGAVTTGTGVLTMGGNLTSNSSTSMASVSGNLALGSATTTISVADPVSLHIDLQIPAAITGSSAITKTGLGNLELLGNNSYTGSISISAGTITAADSNAFGTATSNVTVASGAELDLSGGIVVGNPISVAGTGGPGLGGLVNASGINSLTGPITLTGNTTLNVNAGSLALGGVISGVGFGVTEIGGNTLTFDGSAANTYSGTTTVNAGTLQLTDTGFAAMAGPLVIGDGVDTALVQEGAANQISGQAVTINTAGTLNLNNLSDSVSSLIMTGSTVTTGTGTLTDSGGVTTNASATTASISGKLALAAAPTPFSIASGTTTSGVDLDVSAVVSGAVGVTKSGAGKLELDGANAYSGGTTISTGAVLITNGLALGTGAATVPAGALLDLSGGITVANPISVAGSGGVGLGAIVNASGANSLTGAITLTGNTNLNVSAGSLALGGVISGVGFGVTEIGGNLLTFDGSAANTYTGTTTVNAGTLQLTDTGGAAMAGPLVIGDGVHTALVQDGAAGQIGGQAVTINTSGTLNLNNFNDSLSSLTMTGSTVTTGTGTLTDSGGVTTNASSTTASISGKLALTAATTLSVATGTTAFGVDLDVAAVVSGAVAATKSGAGVLELDGANSYSGGTTVSAGAVQITNGTALGTGAVTVASGAEVGFGFASMTSVANPFTIAGAGGAGAGVLENQGAMATLSGNIALSGSATLGSSGGALSLNGIVSGTGYGLTFTGGGSFSLGGSSANTDTGATILDSGTLYLAKPAGIVSIPGALTVGDGVDTAMVVDDFGGQIVSTSAVTLNAGSTTNSALISMSGVNETVGTLTFTNGGEIDTGTGALTDRGALTYGSTSSTSVQGLITGNLSLAGGTTTISVAQGHDPSGVDLAISANISNGGIIKTGLGTLGLSGTNTFSTTHTVSIPVVITGSPSSVSVDVEIQQGAVAASSNNAFGATNGSAFVATGAMVKTSGSPSIPETFFIAGTGVANQGVFYTTSGTTVVLDPVNMIGASQIGAASGATLNLSAGTTYGGIENYFNYVAATITNGPTGTTILNTYDQYLVSNLTVTQGYLEASNAGSLGQTGTSETDTIGSGASIEIAGGVSLDSAKTLVFNGTGANLGGGVFDNKLINVSGSNTISGPVTLGANQTVNVDSTSILTMSGVVSGGGFGITQNGPGVLDLTATNTLSGNLVINSGVIQVDGNTTSANPQVMSGGTLAGSGHVASSLTVASGGLVQPGPASNLGFGILTVGNATFSTGSALNIQLGGMTAGTNYDQMYALSPGVVSLNNATLNVRLQGAYLPAVGDTYTIVFAQSASGISGTFNGLANGATFTVGRSSFQINYTSSTVVLTSLGTTDTWVGGGGNTNWSTAANWQAGVAPSAGDILVFPSSASGASNNDFTAGTDFYSITLANSAMTFTGNALALDHGITTTYATGSVVFPMGVTLNTNETIAVGGGTLDLSGVVSGAFSLTKTGAGTLDLAGANTYSGGMNVNAGPVSITNNTALGTGTATVASGGELDVSGGISFSNPLNLAGTGAGGGGALVVQSGGETSSGTITLAANTTIDTSSSSSINLNGLIQGAHGLTFMGSGQTVFQGSASNTFSGPINVNSGELDLIMASNSVLAVSANATINVGDGTHAAKLGVFFQSNQLSSTNTVVVNNNAQYYQFAGTVTTIGAMTLNGTGYVNLGGTGSSLTTSSLTINGGSVQMLSGASFSTSAVTTNASSTTATITGGTFNLGSSGTTFAVAAGATSSGVDLDVSSVIAGTTALTKTGLGTLQLDGTNTYSGVTTVSAGRLAITNNTALGTGAATISSGSELDVSNGISFSNPLSLAGTGAVGGGALVVQSGGETSSGTITLAANTTIDTSPSSSINLNGLIQGAHGLTFVGTGQTTFGGSTSNTFTGPLDVNSGTLNIEMGGNSVLGVAAGATINVGDGTDTASLAVNFANDMLSPTNTVVVNNNAQYYQFAGTVTTIGAMTLNGTGYVNLGGGGSSLTTSSLTMNAGSVQMLSGADFSTGAVTTNASSTTATITGGTFNLGSSGTTFAVAAGATSSGVDLDVSSVIAGTTALTKTGLGTLQLDGTNTYSGVTTVSAGRLAITNGTALGTGAATIASGGELDLTGGITAANAITATGTGSGGGGTIAALSGADTLSGGLTLGGSTTIATASNASLTESGVIGDGGNHYALTIANLGTGSVVFTNANTYGGATTVTSGTLELAATNAVSATSTGVTVDSGASLDLTGGITIGAVPLTIAGSGAAGAGALDNLSGNNSYAGPVSLVATSTIDSAAGSLTLSGAIGDGGFGNGIVKIGGGFLDLGGVSTYTGSTVVNAGDLRVNGNIANSSVVEVNASATLSGNGTVGPVVSIGGTVAPADGPNVLTTGSFSLNSASTYSVNLDGTSPGNGTTGYDQVVASGTVSLGGATLSLAVTSGFTPVPGNQFTIIQNNSGTPVSGTFAGLSEGAILTVGSQSFRITYQGGLSGQNVVLEAIAPTTSQVSTSPQTSTYGQSVTFTAQVTASAGTPTGSIDFYNGNPASGGVMLGVGTVNFQGLASYSTPTLHATAGTPDQIYAVYLPSATSPYESSTSTPFSQTVNPAPLTVTANNANMAYGSSALPSFTFSFTGFENGDSASSLTTAPTGAVSTPLSQLHVNSNGYSIVPSGAVDPNYSFTYVAGTLTVTPVTLTITGPTVNNVYGAPVNLTGAAPSYSGFVNGDTATTLATTPDAPPVLGTSATASSPVQTGGYPITVSGAVDADYSFRYVSGTLMVVQASTTSTVSSSAASVAQFQSVTFTATVGIVAPGGGSPTGTVTFYDGNPSSGGISLGAGTVSSASPFQAMFQTASLSLGTHQIYAVYSGDNNFVTSTSSPFAQTISGAMTTTQVSSSASTSVYGQGVSLIANVAVASPGTGTPTGTVQFYDGNPSLGGTAIGSPATLVSGQASVSDSALAVGGHAIYALYTPNSSSYAVSTSAGFTQTVNADSSTTAITLDPSSVNPSAYGQSVTFDVAVSPVAPGAGVPAGTVQLYDGNPTAGGVAVGSPATLTSGLATIATGSLASGSHSLYAVFTSSDGNFTASTTTTPLSQTVSSDVTSTVVTLDVASVDPSVYGQGVTFDLAVSAMLPGLGTPVGTVQIYDGNPASGGVAIGSPATLASGTATIATSALSAGNHSLYAVYTSTSTNFLGGTSASPLAQTVNAASTSSTITLDASSTNPSIHGQGTTFDVAVAAVAPGSGTPTGTVQLYDGNPASGGVAIGSPATLSSGAATLSTATLTAGSHSLYAVYTPANGNYGGDTTATPLAQTVTAASTSSTITLDASSTNPSTYGQSVTFDVAVSPIAPGGGTATGTVQLYNGNPASGGVAVGSPVTLASGLATITTSALSGGNLSLYAVYTPADGNYSGNTTATPLSQTISAASTTNTVSLAAGSSNPSSFGQSVTFNVTIAAAGSVTPTGTVQFYDGNPTSGGTAIGSPATLVNGQASVSTSSLSETTHSIQAVYTPATADFTGSTSPIYTQTVVVQATTTTVTLDSSSSSTTTYGQSVTFDVSVTAASGTPTGTVQFYNGNPTSGGAVLGSPVTLSGGAATFATTSLAAGGHSIYAVYGSNSSTFGGSMAATPVVQTVNPAALSVSAINESMTYGGAVPTLVDSASGFMNGDTAGSVITGSLATMGTSSSNVGTYAITRGTLAADANYTLAFTAGTLSVSPAALSVSATHESMTYGGAVPTLAYSASGFMNGDTAGSVLTGSLATTASPASNVGTYAITRGSLAADANYTLAFTAGTLTVSPAALSITASAASKVFGAPLPSFTATYSGFVNGQTSANLSTPVVFTTSGTAVSPVGAYPLSVSGASDPDYAISFHPSVLTIVQANTSVVFVTPGGTSVAGQPLTFTVHVGVVGPGTGDPTGTVVFEIDGKAYDTAAVNPATGLATFSHAMMGVGPHGITAIYSGDSSFTGSQAIIAQQVDPAMTQTTLTATDVRNRKGRLVWVILTSDVTAVPPGVGSPYGTISFYENGSILTSQTVNGDGLNVVRLKPAQARGKSFFARFGGDPSFYGSASPTITLGNNGVPKAVAAQPSLVSGRHILAQAKARLEAGALAFRWPGFVKHGRGLSR